MEGVGVIPAVDGLRGIGIFQSRFQTRENVARTSKPTSEGVGLKEVAKECQKLLGRRDLGTIQTKLASKQRGRRKRNDASTIIEQADKSFN